MNIGDAVKQTGLPAKTIRYYEEIGLVAPKRAANGYRDYCDIDVHRLAFVQRARSLGFTIDECKVLLSLYDDRNRSSSDVKAMAMQKIATIEKKIDELGAMRATLKRLVQSCHGDDRPECPIMEEMAEGRTL